MSDDGSFDQWKWALDCLTIAARYDAGLEPLVAYGTLARQCVLATSAFKALGAALNLVSGPRSFEETNGRLYAVDDK
jgi:hypothetical protein